MSYDPEMNRLRAQFDPVGAHVERIDHELGLDDQAQWPEPEILPPSEEEVARCAAMGDLCETSDGCLVEPDGVCEHGHPTWARRWGFI